MKMPKIQVQYAPLYDKDPMPYRADIIDEAYCFDHHGVGSSPSEALLLAAAHWHARQVKPR